MAGANARFQAALKLHQNGNLTGAEPLYREILNDEPSHIDANCLLGTLFMQVGRLEESVRYLRQAVALQPEHSIAHNNLGHALHDMGKLDAAIEEYQKAVRINPQFTEALNNLACAKREGGKLDESEAILRRALSLDSNYAPAYFNLGLVALGRADTQAAIGHFKEAVRLRGDYLDAWLNLGHALFQGAHYREARIAYEAARKINPRNPVLLCNLGAVLQRTNDLSGARQLYESALAIEPRCPEAHANLGHLCQDEKKFGQAIVHYETALSLRPDYADPLINLGVCLQNEERFDEAMARLEHALALDGDRFEARLTYGGILYRAGRLNDAERELVWCLARQPDSVNALNTMGSVMLARGQFSNALEFYQRATAIEPSNALAHWNSGTTLLALGQLAEGWREWDWGTQTKERSLAQRYSLPMWGGEDLDGKTILLYGEQGLGDEILFASCVPEIVTRAKCCILQCDPRLANLFARSFPSVIVHGGIREETPMWLDQLGRIDYQCPIGSVPRYTRSRLEQFPSHNGYLKADSEKVKIWRQRLAQEGSGLKVAFAWRGYRVDVRRAASYTDLANWAPILRTPGVTLVSLQTGDVDEEVAAISRALSIRILHFDDLDYAKDIDGVAALIASVDLVLSPEMTVYNLAGALGIPTWVLAAHVMKRPWATLGTDGLPWYPSVRLLQQAAPGDWSELFERAGTQLREMFPRSSGDTGASMAETVVARPQATAAMSLVTSRHEPTDEPMASFIAQGSTVIDVSRRDVAPGSMWERLVGPRGRVINLALSTGQFSLPEDVKACNAIHIAFDAQAVQSLCAMARDVLRWRPLLVLDLIQGGSCAELAGVLDALEYRLVAQLEAVPRTSAYTTVVCVPLPERSRVNPSHVFSDPLSVYSSQRAVASVQALPRRVIPGDASADFFGAAILPYARVIRALMKASGAVTLLEYGGGTLQQYAVPLIFNRICYSSLQDYWGTHEINAYEPAIAGFDQLPNGPFDGVVCADLLTRIPPSDVTWVVKELFGHARRFVFACVRSGDPGALTSLDDQETRSAGWWVGLFECVANVYGVPYLLVIEPDAGDDTAEPQWFGNFELREISTYF